ncbi:MAG TPA: hypothetical protein VGI70_02325 [Polyangiales bacterium]
MSFSERFLAGFALAATIAKDKSASAAEGGLAPEVAAEFCVTARELALLDKSERRARVRALTEPLRYPLPLRATAPIRAYALLARKRAVSEIPPWLRSAPLPRPGYAAERALTSLLGRIAARAHAKAVTRSGDDSWVA